MSIRPTGKRRVLIFASHPIQYQAPLFRALAKRDDLDLQVVFASIPDPVAQGTGFGIGFRWDVPLLEGYPWSQLPASGRWIASSSWRAYDRTLAAWRPDCVMVFGWNRPELIVAAIASKLRRLPIICMGESNNLRRRGWPARLCHWLYLRLMDVFVTIGASNHAFYRSYGLSESRLVRSGYCVDNDFFVTAANRARRDLRPHRTTWGLREDVTTFVFVGKLEPKKRPLDMLEATALARRLGAPPFQVLVVGDGPLRPAAESLVRDRDLPVRFAGFLNQSRVPAAYAVAECLVLPSDYGETWGLVVNEAMASGLPAIVSDRVGCAADLVIPGQTGMIFRFGDVRELAECLRRLAHDREQARIMGQAAQARVTASFSIDRTVTAIAEGVRRACSQ